MSEQRAVQNEAVLAEIEYDTLGNIITADWTKLETYLMTDFLPNNVRVKQKIDVETDEIMNFPLVQLNEVLALRLSVDEKIYSINYLLQNNIAISANHKAVDALDKLDEKEQFINYDLLDIPERKVLPKALSKKETLAKLKLYQETRDPKLREELIIGNMRLASYIVNKLYWKSEFPVEALESYGYEGLIKAIDSFDSAYHCTLSTYLQLAIKWEIRKGLIEIKDHKKNLFYEKYLPVKEQKEKENNTTLQKQPDLVYEILECLVEKGIISPKHVAATKTRILLDHPDDLSKYLDGYEKDFSTSNDALENDYTNENLAVDNQIYLELAQKDASKIVAEICSPLTEREKMVLRHRFGLGTEESKTTSEIASFFHTQRSQIEKIQKRALKKLGSPSNQKKAAGLLELFDQYHYEPNPIKVTGKTLRKRKD